MPSVLVSSSNGIGAPPLADDLERAGFSVLSLGERANFVQEVISKAADLVVCFEMIPDGAFFDGLDDLARMAPRPVAVFTTDSDAGKIARAVRSGIHVYAVGNYDRGRLRSMLHLAQARFESDQAIRTELRDVNRRFAERKLVDRAKGILMGARQLREEEAFRALRSAAMAAKQRIGEISQMVIDSALSAEAMNRAGQLRMLSQRLVKLYALACAGTMPAETTLLLTRSVAQVDAILASLARGVFRPTVGDLIDAVTQSWAALRGLIEPAPRAARLGAVDAAAEAVLLRAERLTANLEIAAYAPALRVINVCGRQRMLCQRLAKEALVSSAGLSSAGSASQTCEAFGQGLCYLDALPMSNVIVRSELAEARQVWASFQAALQHADTEPGRVGIAVLSESLLGHFDRLTDELERAMQALV